MPAADAHIAGPVLIVDDDPDIREILAEALESFGFVVVTAAHGRDALAMLARMAVRPSVILLDLMMPVMDGYGFLEERTKDTKLESIPLAVITAGHGVDRGRIGPSTPIVPKPFEMPTLLRVLRALQVGAEGVA
ncbi:MAG TPA: response regulator [Polyangia bacterium]|nr:response regulator [Polyangia bacterium]